MVTENNKYLSWPIERNHNGDTMLRIKGQLNPRKNGCCLISLAPVVEPRRLAGSLCNSALISCLAARLDWKYVKLCQLMHDQAAWTVKIIYVIHISHIYCSGWYMNKTMPLCIFLGGIVYLHIYGYQKITFALPMQNDIFHTKNRFESKCLCICMLMLLSMYFTTHY